MSIDGGECVDMYLCMCLLLKAGYDVTLMHGADSGDATQSVYSEPLHVAIAGRDVPDYDVIELLIDAGLSLECKVFRRS